MIVPEALPVPRSRFVLLDELVAKHKARPRYRQSLGHNHSSQLLSVGTPDTSVSRELVDFIERTAGR